MTGQIASKAHQRWYVNISGMNDPNWGWNTATGAERTVTVTKMRDGGKFKPDVVAPMPADYGDLTLTRALRLGKQWTDSLAHFEAHVGDQATVTRHYLDGNGTVIGIWRYDCILNSVTSPEHDENSGDAGMIQLILTVRSRDKVK